MSRMMNPGPPVPRALLQARTGERPWPGAEKGLSGAEVGAAIAARIGARRRHSAHRSPDGQARSRNRGSTSSL
jgi:hypothetical protein